MLALLMLLMLGLIGVVLFVWHRNSSGNAESPKRVAPTNERTLGPILYDGPPFEVDITYAAPKMVESRSTLTLGSQEIAAVASYNVGEITQRRVRVESIHGPSIADPRHIVGFCHLRQDERAFAVHRIRELREGGDAPAESPSWYLRQRIASYRGEPPRFQRNESVVLARNVGAPLVVHWRRRIAESQEGELPAERIEIYDARIDIVSHEPTGLRLYGPAKRRRAPGIRAWSGERTFDLRDCVELRAPDDALIADPESYIYGLIGMGDVSLRPAVEQEP